jgi:hypothetical protein
LRFARWFTALRALSVLIAALSRRRNDTQQVSASADHNQPTAN